MNNCLKFFFSQFMLLAILCLPAHAYRDYYYDVILDTSGNPIPSAKVSIYLAGTKTPAKVYSSLTGTTSATYKLTAADGTLFFYFDRLEYGTSQKLDFSVAKEGFYTVERPNINVNNPVMGSYAITANKEVANYLYVPKGVTYAVATGCTLSGPIDAGPYVIKTGDGTLASSLLPNDRQWYGEENYTKFNIVEAKEFVGESKMEWPIDSGLALYDSTTGKWGTSVSDKSTNWNTAYDEKRFWDGGPTTLVPETGRTSLGLGSAATTDATDYATAEQGAKADEAYSWGDPSGLYLPLHGTADNSLKLEDHSASFFQPALTNPVTGVDVPTPEYLTKWGAIGNSIADGVKLGTLTDGRWCTYTLSGGLECTSTGGGGGGGMVYPVDSGLALYDSVTGLWGDSVPLSCLQTALINPVTGVTTPTPGYLPQWGTTGNNIVDGVKLGTMMDTKYCTYTTAGGLQCTSDSSGGGGMVYPGTSGLAKYSSMTGTWELSISDNSPNWNNAYAERLNWDGGATSLVAATGRTSLGLGTAATTNATDYLAAGGTAANSSKLENHAADYFQTALTNPVTGMTASTPGYLTKWSSAGNGLTDAVKLGTLVETKYCVYTAAGGIECTATPSGGGGTVYPVNSGLALYDSISGTWGASVANNSANWDVAYTERYGWDGKATGLNAATGRASLGLGTAATTDSTAYATAAQGVKADTAYGWGNPAGLYLPLHGTADAVKNATLTTALSNNGGNGTITWPAAGATLTVPTNGGTLGSAAFTASTNYLAAGGTAVDSSKLETHPASYFQTALTYPVTGVAAPTSGYLTKWGASGNSVVDATKLGILNDGKWCTYSTSGGIECTSTPSGGGSMVYPAASGITVYNSGTGTWGASITDNSTNWNAAYTDRLKWDGGATGLTASTGRTSLGLGTAATTAATDYATAAQGVKADTAFSQSMQWNGGATGLVAATGRASLGLGTAATTNSTDYLAAGGTAVNSSKLENHASSYFQTALTNPVTGVTTPSPGYLPKWGASGNTIVDGVKLGTLTDTKYCTYSATGGIECTSTPSGGATYPTSTGLAFYNTATSSWGASVANNSANWDTAYTDRLKWDGSATGLVAATGRTSLGLGTAATTASTDYLAATGNAVSSSALKSTTTTGLMNITGPAAGATRTKTTRDANDTLLEQGGSYTPTGTWIWTSAVATWPTFNQDTTGLTNANVPNPNVVVGGSAQTSGKRTYVVCTSAASVTLPKPEPGNQVIVRNAPGIATPITLAGQTGAYYEKQDHSGYGTVGAKLVSGGATTDAIYLLGLDSIHYLVMNSIGIWTDTP